MKAPFSILTLMVAATGLYAQGTAFTYQGRLNSGGTPANGTYDLVFTVFASASGLTDSFANQTNSATSVSNGLFTVTLNLGDPNIFTGEDRWLEIEVRTNGPGGYAKLSPRQKLTPTPYAITAGNLASNGLASIYSGLTNVNALTLGGLSSSNFWKTGGNAGTTPGPNFLGTADNQSLEIQVNSSRALRIEPHGISAPSMIGGYAQNTGISYHGAVVAGGGTSGSINEALGYYAFVGAGHGNKAADYSAVVAGAYNVVPGQLSFIGSGERNTNQANYSVIGGGSNNFIAPSGSYAFIGGGWRNSNTAPYTVVVGGALNTASGAGGAFVGGGGNNLASDYNSVVSGGANNHAVANATAIGGGSENTANNDHSTVGGGQANTASGPASTIAGGVNNSSSGNYATVGGGWQNTGSSYYTTVGGGVGNSGSAFAATVGGGSQNTSSGNYAAVGGGVYNQATNDYATVPGGENNLAGGQYSFAAGRNARALHSGAFVWADSVDANFVSSSSNQFLIRASGGVGIGTTTPAAALHVETARASTTDNTAAFNAYSLGPNVSHIHWGLKGDWYIRSAAGSGKVILQDSGGNVGIGTADPTAMLHVAGPAQIGSGTGTAEAPDQALIFRRLKSTIPTNGCVVARTDKLTLERDGSPGGWRIVNVASPGPTTIAATGLTLAGATVNFVTTLAGAASAGTNTIFTSAQDVVSFRCTFGNSYGPGHLTEVTLTRYGSDYYWMGSVNSTFNQ